MTEAELTDPGLRLKRRNLDVAKLVTSSIAAVTGTATLVVALLVLGSMGRTTATISDCTTPGGRCYQEQQQRNADNRLRLVDASVAANYCAQRTTSLEALQACVKRTLDELGDR